MPRPSEILLNKFEHKPTNSQLRFFKAMDEFLERGQSRSTFILRGYAGTGKTTSIGTLVRILPLFNWEYVLLSPTGRAAKVMSQLSKKTAFTIHKKIYKSKGTDESGPSFNKTRNYHKNTLFIVDEASMIADEKSILGSLLADLIDYAFEHQSNKLMFVGDIAQLPPVMQTESPALSSQHLKERYDCHLQEITLTDITRQALDSGILTNATYLRDQLAEKIPRLILETKKHSDIYKMTAERMQDGLEYAYDKWGVENTLIICRSNRSAVQYNHFIRNTIFYKEDELDAGDLLLIARNNYLYAEDSISSGFLANGDFAEVRKVKRHEEIYGFRFADVEISLIDYQQKDNLEVKLVLDSLHEPTPALTQEQNNSLYQQVLQEYQHLKKKERLEAMKKNPYLNALQVKYAYAMTCHKSQGGQWDAVFVDQGFLPEDQNPQEFIRWLYTAMTRAKNELFLVNFDPKYFNNRI